MRKYICRTLHFHAHQPVLPMCEPTALICIFKTCLILLCMFWIQELKLAVHTLAMLSGDIGIELDCTSVNCYFTGKDKWSDETYFVLKY